MYIYIYIHEIAYIVAENKISRKWIQLISRPFRCRCVVHISIVRFMKGVVLSLKH